MYYAVLAYYMRMHYDDIHFLWCAQVQNLWQYLDWVYYDRSGRMSVYAMNWIVSWFTNKTGFYQFWPILYMFFGWLLCWVFAKQIPTQLKKWQMFSIVVLVYNLYILTAIDFAVFYWPCAMQYYIMGPAMLALLAYANQRQMKCFQWLLCGFLLLIVGLGYEYWTPVVLLALFICGMYYWSSEKWNIKETWAKPQVKRIIVFAVILLALLAIAMLAPGMYRRVEGGAVDEGMIHPTSLIGMLVAYIKVMGTFAYFQAFYLPYYLVLFVIGMCIGRWSSVETTMPVKRIMIFSTGVYALLNVVAMLPPAWTYSGFGIQRYYTPLVLLMIVYIGLMGYCVGRLHPKNESYTFALSVAGLGALMIIILLNMHQDFPMAQKWSSAIDERKEYVLNERDKGRVDDLALEKLPIPYTIDAKYVIMHYLLGRKVEKSQTLYYISDVEDYPNDYSVFIRKAYHLNFDIVPVKNYENERESSAIME